MENQITAAIAAAGEGVSGLTSRETAAVLAGLRLLQCNLPSLTIGIQNIFDDGGTLSPLDEDEIDDLCERINTHG